MRNRERDENGSILILSLWSLVILSVLSVGLAEGVQQKAHVLKNLEQKDKLRFIAEAGLKETISRFAVPRRTFTLRDSMTRIYPTALGDGSYRVYSPYDETTTGSYGYVMMDENRKININKADVETLKRLIHQTARLSHERADRLAYAIVDFRDPDDHEKKYWHTGSEKHSYNLAGLSHPPKNTDFEFVSELAMVRGMDAQILDAIAPFVTVYGDGRVNMHTARPETLVSLDMDPGMANRWVELRKGEDGILGTEDDMVLESLSSMIAQIKEAEPRLPEREEISLRHLITHRRISVTSDHFSLLSEAVLRNQNSSMKIICVYGVRHGIRYWLEI